MTYFCNTCGREIRRGQYYKWIHSSTGDGREYPAHSPTPIGGEPEMRTFRPRDTDTVEAMKFTDWTSAKKISDWCQSVLYVPPGYAHELRTVNEEGGTSASFLVLRVDGRRYRVDYSDWVVKDSLGLRRMTEEEFFLKYEPVAQ